MKHFLTSFLLLSSLCSCTMTGDPSAGGLFGWSQQMSNDRISARDQYNRSIQADTASKRAEASRIQRQMNQ